MPVWLTECIICSLHVSPLFSSLISNQTENTETFNFHSKMYERLIIANVSNITCFIFRAVSQERCGAVVKRRTRDREVPGSIPTNSKRCFLEQETLSTLLSTGFYPGKKRATWKISTRLLNVLLSINKVDYYYYYYY